MAGVYKSIFTGPEIDAKLSERVPSTPSGSPLHDLFVAAGAVWNPSSKSWTVGSVTGISNSVMTRIYSLSHNVLNNSNWDSALYSTDIPVNLPPRKAPNQFTNEINVTASSTFTSSNFKTIYLCPESTFVRFSNCTYLFYGADRRRGRLHHPGRRGVGRRAALPCPTSKTPRGEIRDVARCHGRGAR